MLGLTSYNRTVERESVDNVVAVWC